MLKTVKKHPLKREIFKRDDNVAVVEAVGKLNPKTNKSHFHGLLNIIFYHKITSLVSGVNKRLVCLSSTCVNALFWCLNKIVTHNWFHFNMVCYGFETHVLIEVI